MGQSVSQVTQDRMISRMNTFSNLYSGDTYGNGNVKKRDRFYEQNNNSTLASRFFVHLFAVPTQLEMTKFLADLRTGNAR